MIILDTDVFSLLELAGRSPGQRVRERLARLNPPQPVAVTVITYEEQSRGRLASVSAARSSADLSRAYLHLRQHIENYRGIRILDFDPPASEIANTLMSKKIRVGTLDLRIASIALAHSAVLVTRNLRHYSKVPDLRVEDWTKP